MFTPSVKSIHPEVRWIVGVAIEGGIQWVHTNAASADGARRLATRNGGTVTITYRVYRIGGKPCLERW